MPGTFGWMSEMKLFLNIINGSLILHAEDHGVLRTCLSLYLNISLHFKQVFSTEGSVIYVSACRYVIYVSAYLYVIYVSACLYVIYVSTFVCNA